MRGREQGGLVDRQGHRHLVFDADGTRQVVRQRALARGPERPAACRRTVELAIPGYTGRNRGEVVRSRFVVQQAHSREWLGTFGEAGNGERWPRFERAADGIVAYLRAHGLAPDAGLLRLDGEFGCARAALLLSARGLGYLMRCHDYRLLDTPLIREALTTAPARFVQTDTGTERDVYDVGGVPWTSEVDATTVVTRLIVTCMPVRAGEEPRVGKRVGDRVYELFVTERAPEALTALDVLSLYAARGGFEQTLSEEDQEIDPDRWFSGHPQGQELAQILAQWLWNMRLQLGLVTTPTESRITLWSVAATEVPSVAATEVPSVAATEVPTSSEASDDVSSTATTANDAAATTPFDKAPSPTEQVVQTADVLPLDPSPQALSERNGFLLQPDGTLRCPENKTLRRAEVRRDHVRFAARRADCSTCPRASQCLGTGASGKRGRRVDWPAAALGPRTPLLTAQNECATPPVAMPAARTHFEPPPPPGPEPLYWRDLPATALRRQLPAMLRQQRVDGLTPPPSPLLLDRDRRAHRRLTWRDRMSRNARPSAAPVQHLHLHGIPANLAAYLGAQAPA